MLSTGAVFFILRALGGCPNGKKATYEELEERVKDDVV